MKTLNDFVEDYQSVLTVIKARYEAGYIAFVAHEELIGEIASALSGGDAEMCDIRYGIFATDWYPVGFGGTIEEAIINLNVRVSKFISDAGLEELYSRAYRAVNTHLFYYDTGTRCFVFNQGFSQSQFPFFLKNMSTITSSCLDD